MAFNFKHNAYSFNISLERFPCVVQQLASVNVQLYIQTIHFSGHKK